MLLSDICDQNERTLSQPDCTVVLCSCTVVKSIHFWKRKWILLMYPNHLLCIYFLIKLALSSNDRDFDSSHLVFIFHRVLVIRNCKIVKHRHVLCCVKFARKDILVNCYFFLLSAFSIKWLFIGQKSFHMLLNNA